MELCTGKFFDKSHFLIIIKVIRNIISRETPRTSKPTQNTKTLMWNKNLVLQKRQGFLMAEIKVL